MNAEKLSSGITKDEWSKLAKLAKTTPDKLESQYEAFIAEHPQHLRKIEVKRGDAVKKGDCISRDFSIGLFPVVGIEGYVEFCGPRDDWSGKLNIHVLLCGGDVWRSDLTFSAINTNHCFDLDLTLAKASFCVAFKGSNLCFNIKGNACYWNFGWYCTDFDETLFFFD